MAEVKQQQLQADSARTVRLWWEGLGNDDTSDTVLLGERPDGSIMVVGTFGGATASLQGSNDGTNWFVLRDDAGADTSFTAAGLKMFLQRPWKIRVMTAGGTGTDVDCYLVLGG